MPYIFQNMHNDQELEEHNSFFEKKELIFHFKLLT